MKIYGIHFRINININYSEKSIFKLIIHFLYMLNSEVFFNYNSFNYLFMSHQQLMEEECME